MDEQAQVLEETQSSHFDDSRKIILGKYEMGRMLGKGTFAKVYYAKNLATQESVAIKVINKDQVKKQGLAEQIKREISIMGLVPHPHIVHLKEVMATKERIFFVMEYVKGGELFSKVAKGKLKEDLARLYFQQLISAVDFCHSRGVYHRDIKPENLLLDGNGDLKVSDFGLSAISEQLREDGLLHTPCGTPSYVAPEVLRKRGYDGAKADIWSCGVVLFVLLSGYLPFQDENMMKMYGKIFKADFKFPAWVSLDARGLISSLLVSDPEKRISVAEIMRNPWFRKDFKGNNNFSSSVEEFAQSGIGKNKAEKSTSPPFYNAFEFISSMSSGFDLSNLFESRKKQASLFTTRCSAYSIMGRLKTMANKLNFSVLLSAREEFKVKLHGKEEGRKGKLAVTAEIYEVAPEVVVVAFSKSSGDTLEYARFCEEGLRPALKDIVWSWQGEENKN